MSETSKKSSAGAILSARRLVKEYRDGDSVIRVLTGAELEITRGEALAVTGKSGAGKSTLLHILGLIDSPTEGEVFLDGEDVTKAGADVRARVRNQRFGFVFQSYHLVAELTALENVLLPAMMTGVLEWARSRSACRSRAEELLARVGLAERLRHRPAKLSGGERQRVAIARALMNEPEVLFCDEPTGNLDESTSESIHSILRRLNKDTGVTQVIVTHDRELASQADRVLKIEGGRIVA